MNKKRFTLCAHIARMRLVALLCGLCILLSTQTVLSMPTKGITAMQTVEEPLLTLSTRLLYVASTGGSNSIDVTSNTGWTASSSVTWVTVSPSSGENNGTLIISTEANETHFSRAALVYVKGNGITSNILVTQSPAPVLPPSLTLPTYTLNVAASGGLNSIAVTSNINWTARCDATWLTVSPGSGVNNDTLSISVSPHKENRSRTAFIMVNGTNESHIMRTITVTQGVEPEMMLSAYTLNVAASSNSKNVTVTSNINWTASCDACWLTISPATGTNN
ncbi:MAG: hypothetical protein LBD53_07255, partial [Tannerella sp.]|nr:hypothetical protein [Tannerella sp.]